MAPSNKADHQDESEAKLDEKLTSVEPIDRGTLQSRIGKEAMEKQSGGREINAEMERLPQMAAQPKTQIRCNDNESDETKGGSANRIFERLAGRVNRVDEVQQAEARVFVQKQDGRMQK